MMRLVLAATLSPSYGIYSGYELCENQAVAPGSEEYLNSEKYQIKTRNWDAPGNIKEFVARVNTIRHANPALHQFLNLTFLPADNDQIIFYLKATADGANRLLVAVNLDPFHPQACTVTVAPQLLGMAPGQRYRVTDLLTNASYEWSEHNYVRLDPAFQPAHILRVEASIMIKRSKEEHAPAHPLWYKDAVFYELRVRSFYDSNGDGIGDFPGLTAKLPYLQSLGVTCLWLLPFYPSPLRDDGYDISNYTESIPTVAL